MKVIDSCGQEVHLMNDSLCCLKYLKEQGHQIGVASRIKDISGAYQLIHLLGIAPYFDYREIYPGCKKKHFHRYQLRLFINIVNNYYLHTKLGNCMG